MKLILTIFLNAAFCYVAETYLAVDFASPWWLFAAFNFITALLIRQRYGWMHFLSGSVSIFFVWLFLYYQADIPNQSVLSDKIAAMFSMPNHHVLFILLSVIMSLIGGLASVAGGSFRTAKKTNK